MMRKSHFAPLAMIVVLAMMLFACTSSQHRAVLDSADSLMNARPDSALTLLNALLPDTDQMRKGDLMRFHLLRTNAENKCDTVFTARHATLMQRVCDYYDHKSSPRGGREGVPNSRMLAHYLLGRCYDDMGEAPAALQEFHNAADAADTTRTDCDYKTLSNVYSQTERLFYLQNLFQEQLYACKQASKYALMGRDTLTSIIFVNKMADAYEAMDLQSQAFSIIEETRKKFQELGRKNLASQTLPQYMNVLLQQGNVDLLAELFKEYETESGYFSESGEITSGLELYYWIKGNYYLAIHKTDSANSYYHRCLENATLTENKLASYEGLFRLYTQTHQTDSALKYAQLTVSFKDSVQQETETYTLQNIQSLYRYERHELMAHTNELKAEKAKHANVMLGLVCIFILFILIAVVYGGWLYHNRNRRIAELHYEKLLTEYQRSISMYRQAKSDVEALRQAGSGLETLLKEKETLLNHYAKTIDSLREEISIIESSSVTKEKQDSFSVVMNTRIYQSIAKCLEPPFNLPTEEDWIRLRSIVAKNVPGFYSHLIAEHILGMDELDVCILLRLGCKNKDIGILKEWTESSVSMKCTRTYKKLTGKKGAMKELRSYLATI